MKRLGVVSLVAVLTCLGLDTVYFQAQQVRLGYRVSRDEARLARLRERVRITEVAVHHRRDPAALRRRAEAWGVALRVPAAGHVVRVMPRGIQTAQAIPGEAALVASSR